MVTSAASRRLSTELSLPPVTPGKSSFHVRGIVYTDLVDDWRGDKQRFLASIDPTSS